MTQPLIIPANVLTAALLLEEVEDGVRRMDYQIAIDLPALLGHSVSKHDIEGYYLKINAAGGMVIEFTWTEEQT